MGMSVLMAALLFGACETEIDVYLPDKIGRGYGEMWRSQKRYIVIKGSRRSS